MSKESLLYPIKNILLPTDGSKYSLKAAKYTAEIAKKHGSKVTLFHVLEMSIVDSSVDLGSDLLMARIEVADETQIKERGMEVIRKTKEAIDKAAIHVETKYVISESPREAIVEIAEKENFDLIVMGHRGMGGLKRLMLGSVAEGVCRAAPCPVLIVR